MKILVTGIQHANYTSRKTGQPVVGTSLHYLILGDHPVNLEGYKTDKLWIGSGKEYFSFPWEVGRSYLVYMDGYDIVHAEPIGDEVFDIKFGDM